MAVLQFIDCLKKVQDRRTASLPFPRGILQAVVLLSG